MYENLLSPFKLKKLELKNRIVMTPFYTGYVNLDGSVSELLLEYYKEIGESGIALCIVENAAVDKKGSGGPFMIRIDNDVYLAGLKKLADTIKSCGTFAILQLNHAGKYTYLPEKFAPSKINVWGTTTIELTVPQIKEIVRSFASAAKRVKLAGFDGVELHGGTGYLLAQFLSPLSNKRTDEYGGSLENRMRFGIEVVKAVREVIGKDYLLGYRFLADEWLQGGITMNESIKFAEKLKDSGIDYLSVTAGIHESFALPEIKEKDKNIGFMVEYAEMIKRILNDIPLITAGRIQYPEFADTIIAEGKADLVGLARVLFADPLWPKKAYGIIKEEINICRPSCHMCTELVKRGKSAICTNWPEEKRKKFLK